MTNDPNARPPGASGFALVSPDFADGDTLPVWARSGIARAGGEDRSPTLHWEDAPSGARSFAVTVHDPDASAANGWWHWAVFNIPAKITSLAQDAGNPEAGLLPAGAITLVGTDGLERFVGAAPPAGHGEHRYIFTVSALDSERLDLPPGSDAASLDRAIADHIVAQAQLVGVAETPA